MQDTLQLKRLKSMLETFVLLVCIKGIGCQDTVNAYYEYNKELQESVKTLEKSVKNAAGDKFNTYVYPLALTYLLNRDLVIPLSHHMYLETNKTASNTKLRWTYEF